MSNCYKRIKPEPPTCPHNEGVVCLPGEHKCSACGWNPELSKARLEAFCVSYGIQLPLPVQSIPMA